MKRRKGKERKYDCKKNLQDTKGREIKAVKKGNKGREESK